MSDVDRDALRVAAESATPGPWETDTISARSFTAVGGGGRIVSDCDYSVGMSVLESRANAAHIATADPPTVLALLDALAAAEARADRAEKAIAEAHAAWSRIDRLGNRTEYRIALDRALGDGTSAVGEFAPPDHEHEQNEAGLIAAQAQLIADGYPGYAAHVGDARSTLRAHPTLDRDELARAIHEADEPTLGYERRYPEEPPGANWSTEESWRHYLPHADAVVALFAAVGQDTPEPEWTDPQPWVNPVTGARDEAEWDGVVGAPIYSPRSRAQYDAEQGT